MLRNEMRTEKILEVCDSEYREGDGDDFDIRGSRYELALFLGYLPGTSEFYDMLERRARLGMQLF